MLKIVVYSSNNPEDACGYLRIQAPFEANGDSLSGIWGARRERKFFFRMTVLDETLIDTADIILVQRSLPRKSTRAVLEKILNSGKPVVFEIDDLLIDPPADHPYRRKMVNKKPFIIDVMRRASAVTVTTVPLKEALRKYNDNIHVLPNLLDERLWNKPPRMRTSDRVVIAFGGTKSHLNDLKILEEPLFYIADKYRGRVSFRLGGVSTGKLATLPGLHFVRFTSSYSDYARELQDSDIDIALVPLQDNLFNRCKSNIKWLEYSACGIAGIYSSLSPYSDCIEQGKTGILAGMKGDEWIAALELLIDDPEKRRIIAREAREKVLSSYTLAGGAALYRNFYQNLVL